MQNVMSALLKQPPLRTCKTKVHCWQDLPVSPDVAQRVRKILMQLGPKRLPRYETRFGRHRQPSPLSKNRMCRHCPEEDLKADGAWTRYAQMLENHRDKIGAHVRIMRSEREGMQSRHRSLKAELGIG